MFKDLYYVGFTGYDASLKSMEVAFEKREMHNTLGEVLASEGLTQLRIAESTKYAHVTYFFNGGIEKANKNEDRILIKTKKVKTFDLMPEMSANEIAEVVIEKTNSKHYDFVLINFANCDMVGHTGNFEATVKAVEAVDGALGKLLKHFKQKNANVLVTADHGNAESLLDDNGNKQTAHTLNPVPFILVSEEYKHLRLKKGSLADVSSTVLDCLGINAPKEFSATSLIIKD